MGMSKNLCALLVLLSALSVKAGSEIEGYKFDATGNRTQIDDDQNRATKFTYDSLDRLRMMTNRNGSVARMNFNSLDQVTQIVDPRGLITNFALDPLQTRSETLSPDTGRSVVTFSDGGMPLVSTDSWGRTTTSTYDASGRIKTFFGSSAGPNITYNYDQGVNGKGQLTSMTDATGASKWAYNNAGQVLTKEQNAGSNNLVVKYDYDQAGQRISIGYPSTNKVAYKIIAGQVREITVNGVVLISAISYNSMGAVQGWTWSSGVAYLRSFDMDGRLKSFPLGSNRRTLDFFPNGKIKSFTDTGSTTLYNQSFTYDSFDRLQSFTNANGTQNYEYDNNGNQTKSGTSAYSIESNSNRLLNFNGTTYTYNPVGTIATQFDGTTTTKYTYDSRNHLIGYSSSKKMMVNSTKGKLGAASYMLGANSHKGKGKTGGGTMQEVVTATGSYQINGISQRTSKTVDGLVTNFMYGDDGKLLGEYDSTGKMKQEIVYLGDTPVAVIRMKSTATLPTQVDAYNIYTDHLRVPRVITDAAGAVVWRWDFAQPYNEQNEPIRSYVSRRVYFDTFNLRDPGQYYDGETKTVHMRFRDYSPALNRFLQPDPAGLYSSYSPYTYANSDPVNWADAYGLAASADANSGASDSQFSQAVSIVYNKLNWFNDSGFIDLSFLFLAVVQPEIGLPLLGARIATKIAATTPILLKVGNDTKWVAKVGDDVYKCLSGVGRKKGVSAAERAVEKEESIRKAYLYNQGINAMADKGINVVRSSVARPGVLVQKDVSGLGKSFAELGFLEQKIAIQEADAFAISASKTMGGSGGQFIHNGTTYFLDKPHVNSIYNPCGTLICNYDPFAFAF